MTRPFITSKDASLSILFILLLFSPGIVSAQISLNKVDSLNIKASQLQQEDPGSAIELAKAALKLNNNGLYREGLYRSYLNLGMAYTRTSTYDSAVAFLRKAEVFFTEGQELGLIKYFLGLNYCNLQGYQSARTLFLDAETLFTQSQEIKHLADVFRALGFVEMHLGNVEQALDYLMGALQKKRQANANATQELLLISELFADMSNGNEALRYANRAWKEAKNFGSKEEAMDAALQVGFLYEQSAEVDSARTLYQKLIATGEYELSAAKLKAFGRLTKLSEDPGGGKEAMRLIQEYLASANSAARSDILQLQANLVALHRSSGEIRQAILLGEPLIAKLSAEGMLNEAMAVSREILRAAKDLGQFKVVVRYQEERHELQQKLFETKEVAMQVEWRNRLKFLDLSNEITFESQSQEVSTLRRERLVLLISLALGVVLIALLVLLLWYRNQMLKGLAEKDSIKKTMHQAQEDLYKQTLHMMHMNNCLNEVEEQVKLLMAAQPDQKLSKILKSIRMNKSMDRDWDNFNSYFGNVNVGFYEKLSARSEKLSNHDRRVCALIKLNLTNREIATILNIEVKSVSMIKYRIKKKLGLEDEMELSHFITQL